MASRPQTLPSANAIKTVFAPALALASAPTSVTRSPAPANVQTRSSLVGCARTAETTSAWPIILQAKHVVTRAKRVDPVVAIAASIGVDIRTADACGKIVATSAAKRVVPARADQDIVTIAG